MRRKGIVYDVGSVMFWNWRPDYHPRVVRRELQIIAEDLRCTAVKIRGRDIDRVVLAGDAAAELGMEAWLCPELWEKSPNATIAYLEAAATRAEQLRQRRPDQVILSVGTELSLFMRGILPGRTLARRARHLKSLPPAARRDTSLRSFLNRAADGARRRFDGPITYASLPFEQVDWDHFDIVGVNHYWYQTNADRYVEALQPWLALEKPVVVSELGFQTRTGADETIPDGSANIAPVSVLLNHLPGIGPRLQPRVKTVHERNELLQATALARQLDALDATRVDGAFIYTFIEPIFIHGADPRHDLDADSFSLVKTLPAGRHGTRYPDMIWEPKRAFTAVADYYASH